MIVKTKLIKLAKRVAVNLPAGSKPLKFINQSGTLYLWYLDSGQAAVDTFNYLFASKGDDVPDIAEYMDAVKMSGYKHVFRI